MQKKFLKKEATQYVIMGRVVWNRYRKEREQYKALYSDLNSQLKSFNSKLKTMEGKSIAVPILDLPNVQVFIPEDVFGEWWRSSEKLMLYEPISLATQSLSSAVDAAYERYKYYERLAEQERRERKLKQTIRLGT